MANTICIDCGRKDKCPKFTMKVIKPPKWWEDYEDKWISDRDEKGNTQLVLTYVIHKCSYFIPKQIHKLPPVLNVKQKKFIHKESVKMYIPENSYEENNLDRFIEKKKQEKEKLKKAEIKRQRKEELDELEQMDKLNNTVRSGFYWNEYQTEFLKTNYNKLKTAQISEIIGKTVHAIINKAKALNLPPNRNVFTDKEIEILKEFYQGKTQYKDTNELAKAIGRLPSSIRNKARQLGLRVGKRRNKCA